MAIIFSGCQLQCRILAFDVVWLNMVVAAAEITKANVIPLGLLRTTEGYDPKETVDIAKKVLR